MEALTRVAPILIVGIFLTSLLMVPSVFVLSVNSPLANVDGPFDSQALLSQIPHNARIAIYNEANLTVPDLSLAVNLTNNIAELTTLLEGAGHSVEALSTGDILNHELMTADYDVFILANQLPRESITDLVREFWLGGGGLLTLDGAVSFLWYGGIFVPGSTSEGYGPWWQYIPTDSQNVTVRHPTMKDYHINDTVYQSGEDLATVWGPWITGLDNGDDYTLLLHNSTNINYVTGFARESSTEGGRIVFFSGDGSSIPADFQSIIIDSVEWLIPKPKGRIVYDLSHKPRIGVDPWDAEFITIWTSINSFTQFRTLAVNNTYTFDKLYPSASGNLTAVRLAKYDVLVIVWPDVNFTTSEMTAVDQWVNDGGSLLMLGDRTGLGGDGNDYINLLLHNFDMSLGTSDILGNLAMTPQTHVTLEGCTSITLGNRNYLNVIGTAVELWTDSGNAVVAAQDFGDGRAILSADMNIFDNSLLPQTNNVRFSLNVLDWLTANDAEILVFSSLGGGMHSDVLTAMRDLGYPFQSFYTNDYVDDFLDSKDWNLFVVEQGNYFFDTAQLDALYAYVNGGGKLVMSYFDIDDDATHPLWSLLGVEHAGEPGDFPTLYLWDSTHRIFNEPNDHSAANYTSSLPFTDDGDELTVLNGFTALAGSSANAQDGKAFIVMKNDYQTLYNGFLISGAQSDEDDSTYRDSIELWENEIAFMLNPPGGLPFNLDPMTILLIGVGVLAIVVIGAVVLRSRGSASTSKPKKKTTKKK